MDRIVVGDYVIAVVDFDKIKKNSVGLVREVSGKVISVFFVGANQVFETSNEYLALLDLKKTGKPFDIKICNICHILKDMNEFDINQTDAKGRKTTRPSCKNCRIDIDGVPLKPSERRRLDAIKPKDIFVCPICRKTSIVGITANLVKDHNHHTGEGREWICDSCNTGLGRFKDDLQLLEAVVNYLKRFEKL